MKKGLIYLIPFIGLLLIGGLTSYVIYGSEKTGYVTLSKVYEEFQLTKQYDSQLKSIQFKRKFLLDSLQADIMKDDSLRRGDAETLINKKKAFFHLQKQFDDDNATITRNMNDQIWKQLNQYLQEFGKDYNYTYIYGAEGTGSLMFANTKKDITKEAVQYINNKYKG